jgi:hypothetical protein
MDTGTGVDRKYINLSNAYCGFSTNRCNPVPLNAIIYHHQQIFKKKLILALEK